MFMLTTQSAGLIRRRYSASTCSFTVKLPFPQNNVQLPPNNKMYANGCLIFAGAMCNSQWINSSMKVLAGEVPGVPYRENDSEATSMTVSAAHKAEGHIPLHVICMQYPQCMHAFGGVSSGLRRRLINTSCTVNRV